VTDSLLIALGCRQVLVNGHAIRVQRDVAILHAWNTLADPRVQEEDPMASGGQKAGVLAGDLAAAAPLVQKQNGDVHGWTSGAIQ
jgi:hypothetical protein